MCLGPIEQRRTANSTGLLVVGGHQIDGASQRLDRAFGFAELDASQAEIRERSRLFGGGDTIGQQVRRLLEERRRPLRC